MNIKYMTVQYSGELDKLMDEVLNAFRVNKDASYLKNPNLKTFDDTLKLPQNPKPTFNLKRGTINGF